MKALDNMKLEELKPLLSHIRSYADMTKKLGLRGRKLFSHALTGEKEYTVEYFPLLGEKEAWSQAQLVFEKSFWEKPKQNNVSFIPLEWIKGGMKVYVDDNMVDVSYKKVESLLQK